MADNTKDTTTNAKSGAPAGRATSGAAQTAKPAKKAPETMLVAITGSVHAGKKKGTLDVGTEHELPIAEAQRLIDLKVAEKIRVSTKAATEPAE